MYVPAAYRPPERGWVLNTIRAYPLALLVSGTADVPFATHLLAVPAFDDADGGPLEGRRLLGHLNRANPHWRGLADGGRALLVFSGPHSYVSPTVYGVTPAAPTWNYVSVHVRGRVRPIHDPESTSDVVRRTAACCEARFGNGWQQAGSLEYFAGLLPGVGAFELVIEEAEGMFKLSQDQTPALRDRVLAAFEGSPATHPHELARLMRELREPAGEPGEAR